MQKWLEKIAKDPRVKEVSDERKEGDGIWVYLNPGTWNPHLGCHLIHEYNREDVESDYAALESCEQEDGHPCGPCKEGYSPYIEPDEFKALKELSVELEKLGAV